MNSLSLLRRPVNIVIDSTSRELHEDVELFVLRCMNFLVFCIPSPDQSTIFSNRLS